MVLTLTSGSGNHVLVGVTGDFIISTPLAGLYGDGIQTLIETPAGKIGVRESLEGIEMQIKNGGDAA